MQPLERGRVVRTSPEVAEVEIVPSAKCKKCCACEISGSGKILIEADNPIAAQIGDVVEVQISSSAKNLFPLIFLGIPILFFFIGITTGNNFSESYGIILGFVFMAVGFLLVLVAGRMQFFMKRYGNKIIRRVK